MSFQVRALDLPLSWRSAATNEAADELGDRGSGGALKVSSQLFRATIPSTREKKRSHVTGCSACGLVGLFKNDTPPMYRPTWVEKKLCKRSLLT